MGEGVRGGKGSAVVSCQSVSQSRYLSRRAGWRLGLGVDPPGATRFGDRKVPD